VSCIFEKIRHIITRVGLDSSLWVSLQSHFPGSGRTNFEISIRIYFDASRGHRGEGLVKVGYSTDGPCLDRNLHLTLPIVTSFTTLKRNSLGG